MVLSHVQTVTPMAIVRASAWANSLSRMGVHLPLFLIHDIGVMLSLSRGAGGYVLRWVMVNAGQVSEVVQAAAR